MISIKDFSQREAIPEKITAAGALDYIYELGDNIGVFRVVDTLARNLANGMLPIEKGPASKRLYDYLKRKSDRLTQEERGMIYQRVLNKGDAKASDGVVVNKHFPALWNKLMTEVATFIEKTEAVNRSIKETSHVSRRAIYQTAKELQHNLTEYCTGMALTKIQELYDQLKNCFDIINDEEIVVHFCGAGRKSFWTVIEQISKQEFGYVPNIHSHRDMAQSGKAIFDWLASFNEKSETDDRFNDFLQAVETYILAASSVESVKQWADGESDSDNFDKFEDF